MFFRRGIALVLQSLVFLNLLLAAFDAGALNIIRNFTVEDGLPSTEVYWVHQDHKGYLWFCTDRGLSRYDGYTFNNYSTDDGLAYNTVFRIFEAPGNDLWISGFNGTLSVWDAVTNTFRPFEKNDELQQLLGSYNWVQHLQFRSDTLLIYPYTPNTVFMSIAGRKGIAEVDISLFPADKRMVNSNNKGNNNIYCIRSARRHAPYYQSVKVFEPDVNQQYIQQLQKVMWQYENQYTFSHIYGFEGKYAFCAKSGLILYDESGGMSRLMPGIIVSCVIKDNENNLWITTTQKGVFVARLDEIRTHEFATHLGNGEKITLVHEWHGHLLIGTNKGRVIDFKSGRTLGPDNNKSDIHSIVERNDTLYASYGITITDDGGELRGHRIAELENSYITLPTGNGNYFYTTFDGYGYLKGNSVAINKTGRILHAHLMSDGTLFYSKYTGIWEVRHNQIEQPIDHTEKLKLENITVRKIYELAPSILVLATSGSGIVIVKDGRVMTRITDDQGLPSNMINACYIDSEYRRIWCSTNRGVSILDYVINEKGVQITGVTNLNKSHGLASNYISNLMGMGPDVMLAGDNNITSIPRTFRLRKVRPPKVDILAFLNSDSNYLGKQINFKHYQNNIEVFFNAFSLQKPLDGYFYKYRLRSPENKKERWVYTNDRGVWFKDLPAGSYVFEVSAKSLNSNWSAMEMVDFEIEPFFLNRLWVRATIFLTASFLIFLFVRRYFVQLRLENTKALEIKNLQLKNNKLELEALRGQMNPHFIFNALKSVQNLILTEQKWEANDLLTKFSKLIRSSLEYSRTDFIPLEMEVRFLENYLDIEKSRTPGRFEYRIDLDQVEDNQDIKIPGLLVQPICENAIKHAFQQESGGLLEIVFSQEEDEGIVVTVMDNGIGYYNALPRDATTQHSMGLSIVRSRLSLFNEQGYDTWLKIYPRDADTKKGTIITFKLPCE